MVTLFKQLQKASKYATFIYYGSLKASSNWLEGFKKRNNIAFKTSIGDVGLIDYSVCKNWLKNILPK